MNITDNTSEDVNIHRGNINPLYTGLTSDVLPEVQKSVLIENSQTGVSTRNVPLPKKPQQNQRVIHTPRWYALRCTYGKEKQAYEYLINKNVTVFYPTITTIKLVKGKRKSIKESRFPNILFVYGTEKDIKSYVYDNINLPYLRFYYRHFHKGTRIIKEPLVVPDYQIESLKIICTAETKDILFIPNDVHKFKEGQPVRIIDGAFKGIMGKVARYQGQQRVAVIIDGLLTIATAYIPSAFLEKSQKS